MSEGQFDLSIYLITPVQPIKKTVVQLNEIWALEAAARCGSPYKGTPLDFWKFDHLPTADKSTNRQGELSLKLAGVRGSVTCDGRK